MNTVIRHVELNGTTAPVMYTRTALSEQRVRAVLGCEMVSAFDGARGRKLLDYARNASDFKVVGNWRKGQVIYLHDGIDGRWDRVTLAD